MKDNKVARIRQKIAMFGRQFLPDGTGVFSQALGEQELAAVMNGLVEPYRERIYPPLDTLRLFVGQVPSPSDRACHDVVGRRLPERIARGQSESALTLGFTAMRVSDCRSRCLCHCASSWVSGWE